SALDTFVELFFADAPLDELLATEEPVIITTAVDLPEEAQDFGPQLISVLFDDANFKEVAPEPPVPVVLVEQPEIDVGLAEREFEGPEIELADYNFEEAYGELYVDNVYVDYYPGRGVYLDDESYYYYDEEVKRYLAGVDTNFTSNGTPIVISEFFTYTDVVDRSIGHFSANATVYPEPSFWVPANQTYENITDVTVGDDPFKSIDSSRGFRSGDFWVEGTLTPDIGGLTLQSKLGVTDRYSYYTGLTAQTLQTADGTLVSEIGTSVIGVDFQNERYRSLAFFPTAGVILLTDDSDSVNSTGYTTDITLYNLFGGNVHNASDGLFFANKDGSETRNGKFAGAGAKTLFSAYERTYSGSQYAKGVEIASRTATSNTDNEFTDIDLDGQTIGVYFQNGGATLFAESETDNLLEVEGNSSFNANIENSEAKDYIGTVRVREDNVRMFVSKDAFFINLDERTTLDQNSLGINNLDDENSYLAGVPGLNSFKHIGWGIWALTESGNSSQSAFGYASFGNKASHTPDIDLDSLRNNSSVFTYTGAAMGSVFNSGDTPTIQFGSTKMTVDFGTGGITGEVGFSNDSVQLFRAGGDIGSAFNGAASLNGGGSGYFNGQFFGSAAEEAAGTFGATNGNRIAIGAYGVKK
ncbi:MAG: hypothetical protein ACI9YB_003492, partial [Halioglobus sp.]